MAAATQNIPHFTYCDRFQMNALLALKKQLEVQSHRVSFMSFCIKSLSLALMQHPRINAQYDEKEQSLTYLPYHHIGFAVDTPQGLCVPNIKHCQQKSMQQIDAELQDLIQRGREFKLKSEELQQGTITLSNIGSIGGTCATPIIHQNQLAIVALGKIQKVPGLMQMNR